ncbi:glycine-rich cell wall structural protein 1.8-like [Orbicella faveolata]|uniref:glycine-rich cell wall structural protein 1.8-like n=1 Tax=Orbicella faveolata TaxID=48498 RepID=UPI0009E21829|nr:glycine-rich cell wall structural protein 1.8-like [Orbicella faveolata]
MVDDLILAQFTTKGGKGRVGTIQKFTVPRSARYLIKAWGARGGTHSYNYGYNPGTYYGGKGAYIEGKLRLTKGTVLNIVVGQRGGNSVEVKGGQSTTQTAAQLGLSVEENAGTGGGGGSFVYTSNSVLLLAAGGGGGASSEYNGVDGQAGTSGTSSVGKESLKVRKGGTGGQPGECNTAGGNYHGGVGADDRRTFTKVLGADEDKVPREQTLGNDNKDAMLDSNLSGFHQSEDKLT